MEENEYKKQRKSNRLPDFNYDLSGVYFITLCVKERACLLSEILCDNDTPELVLNDWGEIAKKYIESLNSFYDDIVIDNYVIMPNHIHILLRVVKPKNALEKSNLLETNGSSGTPTPTNAILPRFVSTLKRFCNKDFGMNIFQRSYHDHIIRDIDDYNAKYEYINNNPTKWELDEYHFINK